MTQPHPGLPGADGTPRRQQRQRRRIGVIGVVLIVLAVLAAVRVVGNEMNKNSAPVSCQLLGGSWSLWSGWRCG